LQAERNGTQSDTGIYHLRITHPERHNPLL